MAARRPWQEGAGPWVSWVDRPHQVHGAPAIMRSFRWSGWGTWTTILDDAMRYDTKAEALADIAGPRSPGVTRHAMRYEQAKAKGVDKPENRGLTG